VQQTVVIFRQTIIVNQANGNSASREDGWTYLIALAALIAGITWGYSRYSTEILGYWLNGLFSSAAFIVSACIASAIRGQYSSSEWAWYIFAPVLFVVFSFYLIYLAQIGIIPNAREVAQLNGFIDYYFKVLQDEHRTWLLLQIGGVFLGILATLTAASRSVHYLALMNQRTTGSLASFWHSLARITLFSGRRGGIIFLLVLTAASYLMLSGSVYEFVRK